MALFQTRVVARVGDLYFHVRACSTYRPAGAEVVVLRTPTPWPSASIADPWEDPVRCESFRSRREGERAARRWAREMRRLGSHRRALAWARSKGPAFPVPPAAAWRRSEYEQVESYHRTRYDLATYPGPTCDPYDDGADLVVAHDD